MEINPKFKKIAILAAKESGKIIEENSGKINKISFKKDKSSVTKIDLKSEKRIIQLIKNNFPSHNILREEGGGKIKDGYAWIIDPLDGTTNYAKTIPLFAVSIALAYKRKPILGVIFDPLRKELYYAEKGKGAFLNGKRIKIGQQKELFKTVILFSQYRGKENYAKTYRILGKINKTCGTFRFFGSAALSLCYIASGKADAFLGIGLNAWDLAAGNLLIEESGGRVADFKGRDWEIEKKDVVAANKKIHSKLLKIINKK